MKGEDNNGITIANVQKIVLAILGIDQDMVEGLKSIQNSDQLGYFDEKGVFHFCVADI